jgi:diamine N-acetyltransferase
MPLDDQDSANAVVRRATVDDAALLHAVAAATFALACPPETSEESILDFVARYLSVDAFTGYLSDPERALCVAEAGAALAGYTMLVFGEPSDTDVAASVIVRPTAELSKVYVRAEHHGVGIGAALVEASVDHARSRGARSMWLGVNEQNQRANRFYEKQGFAIVGTKKFLLGGRYEDDFVRERMLA